MTPLHEHYREQICTNCKKREVAEFGLAGVDIEGKPVSLCAECSAEAVENLGKLITKEI